MNKLQAQHSTALLLVTTEHKALCTAQVALLPMLWLLVCMHTVYQLEVCMHTRQTDTYASLYLLLSSKHH